MFPEATPQALRQFSDNLKWFRLMKAVEEAQTQLNVVTVEFLSEVFEKQEPEVTVEDLNPEMVEEKTQLFFTGIKEAGPDFAKYYYISAERFATEIQREDTETILYKDNEGNWKRKHTNMPVWVVGLNKTN